MLASVVQFCCQHQEKKVVIKTSYIAGMQEGASVTEAEPAFSSSLIETQKKGAEALNCHIVLLLPCNLSRHHLHLEIHDVVKII